MRTHGRVLLTFLALVLLMTALAPTSQAAAPQVFFTGRPIGIFGDPEISKTYIAYAGIWIPNTWSRGNALFATVNLSIPNPSSIQFFVNGSPVQTYNMGPNYWMLATTFQPGQSYTISVRVDYPVHYNAYNCGTWGLRSDLIVPV
jgi:hypothetical protein